MTSKKRRRDDRDDSNTNDDHRSKRHKRSESGSKKKRKDRGRSDHESSADDRTDKADRKCIDHPTWDYKRIDASMYYRYHTEFADWALTKHRKYLDEMTTKKSQKLFKKFVRKWNGGKLAERYYRGQITSLSVDNRQRTRYQWSFEKRMDSKEQMQLQLTKDTIDTETNQPGHHIVERFTRRFKQKREREERHEQWERKRRGGAEEVDFENDGDGVDAETKLKQQRDRENQRSVDRRKRIKDIRKQHREMERRKANSQMLASFQSFVTEPNKKRKQK